MGVSAQRVEYPVRTNQIPRQIPTQVLYLRPLPSILLGGILPFGAIFIELYFILNSIWFNRCAFSAPNPTPRLPHVPCPACLLHSGGHAPCGAYAVRSQHVPGPSPASFLGCTCCS
jgi:hypothetical protein